MPGAWEIPQTVLVNILSVDFCTTHWALGLRRLIIPGGIDPQLVAGLPFDHARNKAAEMTLQNGVDWCMFLDSDVIPPPNAILRMMSHRRPVISGVYARRSPPHALPVAQKGGRWVEPNLPPNTLMEVDVVGAGCLLIHRSVFEKMPHQDPRRGKTHFDWRVDMPGLPPGEGMSEDFTWCLAVRRNLGIPILLDTGVVCAHVGFAEARPGSFLPMGSLPIPPC